MNREKFTIKANQIIEKSLQVAEEYGNQEIKPLHLVFSILSDNENIVPEAIKKVGINLNSARIKIEEHIQKLPKVSGVDIYGGKEFRKCLDNSQKIADKFKDEYISTEHIFLSVLEIQQELQGEYQLTRQ